MDKLKEQTLNMMRERGISVDGIAELVLNLQKRYNNALTLKDCVAMVDSVLDKRDVQYAILTGLVLDIVAENGTMPEPLRSIIATDEPLYGMDEVLAMAITNIYGTIGVTSFGYLDKTKLGLVGELDGDLSKVNTFADDLVAAIASAAAAKIAHNLE